MSQRVDLRERIAWQRAQRIESGRLRERISATRREGVRIEVGGRWLIDFASNDYLGLAQHPAVIEALRDTAACEGVGGRASHLVNGHHTLHDALEREIADWLQVPNHASLIDGARLAGCQLRRYPHADAEGARRQLRASPAGAALIATDGVFSMDGDIAPLSALAGPDGRGSVAAAGLADIPLQLVTLGKALGGYGAVLAGETALIQHLISIPPHYRRCWRLRHWPR